MSFHCEPAEGEPEACSDSAVRIELPELLEDSFECRFRNPRPVVTNGEAHMFTVERSRDRDRTCSREPDGIGDEVDERAAQLPGVAGKRWQISGHFDDERRLAFPGERRELFGGGCDERERRQNLVVELRRARFHLLDVEKIVDHAEEGFPPLTAMSIICRCISLSPPCC